MKNLIIKDRSFYRNLLIIALPVAMQNLISSSLNMVDTIMIGRLGDENVAAVGMANQIFFLFILLLFGLNSGTSIFTAQYWGKNDIKNIRANMGLTLVFGLLIGIIFFLAGFLFNTELISFFSKDSEVVNKGAGYLKIVSLGYLATALSMCFSFSSRSVGKAVLPMIISGIALLLNTFLNYCLIFGNFGFPELGLNGAAIATIIARFIELFALLIIFYQQKHILAGNFKEFSAFNKKFALNVGRTVYPVLINEALWSLGIVVYTAAIARISTEAMASYQIATTIFGLFFVVFIGLGSASGAMIGKQIGAGNNQEAIDYARTFAIITPLAAIFLGTILWLTTPFALSFYKVSPMVLADSAKILLVMSVFMIFKMFNGVLVVGILRSGGDTKYSMFLEMCSVWLVGVPIAFISALVFKLPVYWVVCLIYIEEIVKACFGFQRFISQKWLKKLI